MSEIAPGDVAYISIHCKFFSKYLHPVPLVGDQSIMRVIEWFIMPTKSGKSVRIKFSSFGNSKNNVDLAWLKKWGMEKALRAGFMR